VRGRHGLWFWHSVWALGVLAGLGILLLYTWLPADGATGDLESFAPEGFRVQWLLEERENGLRSGDVIVQAGGRSIEEWLAGAPRGPEWRTGGTVEYVVLRDGQPLTLSIRLAPVPLGRILERWAPQLLGALAFFLVGTFIFWKRPLELQARLAMLFCVAMALQHLGDAYNFQPATVPWRWPLWAHLVYEHATYSLSVASGCAFALVFPTLHPLARRFPKLVPLALYAAHPLLIGGAMALSNGYCAALQNGNQASWAMALIQIAVAIGAGFRSLHAARDPVTRAQISWIVWTGAIWSVVLIPGYVVPRMLGLPPLLTHPVMMILLASMPFVLAIVVLRYRLFDIQVVINQTLVYGTLTALLGGLYLLLVRLLTWIVQVALRGENETLVVFLATLSIALTFNPLRQRVQAWIDRAFYRTKVDYQRLLQEVSERLSTSIVPQRLEALLTRELPRRLQITWSALAVLDASGKRFAPSWGDHPPALPVEHPLVQTLRRAARPLLRLQHQHQLPSDVQTFFDQNGVKLCIPLIVGTELVGIYYLGQKLSGSVYTRDEVRLLHLLGRQAAVAVENSRLFEATERQAKELAILHEAAVAVSSSLEMGQVLETLAEQLGRALDASCVHICDFDGAGLQSTILAMWPCADGPNLPPDPGAIHDLRQTPATLQALLGQRPLTLRAADAGLDTADRESAQQHGWKSRLIVPLVTRDQVIGYAELWETRREREFTAAEVRLCRTLAADAAAAFEHARLFRAEREQRKFSEALEEAAAVVSSTLDIDQVLDRILEEVERVVDGDAFNIMLIEGEVARMVRSRGYDALDSTNRITAFVFPVSHYPNMVKMREYGHPIAVPDTRNDPDWVVPNGWEWLRSYVSAPILVGGQTVGFLNVDGTRTGQFVSADAWRLEAFAHHAATAIRNARLYQETARRLAQTQVLRGVMLAAASTLDFDQVLQRTCDTLEATLQTEYLGVVLPDEEGKYLRPHPSTLGYATAVEQLRLPLNKSICGQVFQTGEPAVVGDVQQVPIYYSGAAEVRSELGIPIRVGGRVIGVLNVESKRLNAFDEEDLAFYSAIAGQLGMAMENAQLYQQVRQHATELAAAVSQLQELDRLKSEFIQSVSHELRSPLALIRGYAELLDQEALGELGPEQRMPVSVIARRARMLSTLVEDIMLILETESRPGEPEPLLLDELVQAAVEDFQVAIKDAGLTVRVEIDAARQTVNGSIVSLRRVLDNLIGNAIKFTRAGGAISVRLRREADQALLEVSDTGIGIEADQLERIFERFYQVDGSIRRRYGGVGLGLALVKEVVTAHEGTVQVESTPGEGSTFAVRLPLAESQVDRDPA
jgi:signal transduction histidine kinase